MRFIAKQIIRSLDTWEAYKIDKVTRTTYFTHKLGDKNMTYGWSRHYVETNFVLIDGKRKFICMDCGKRNIEQTEIALHDKECV